MEAQIYLFLGYLQSVTPSQWIQAFYLAAAGGIVALQGLPSSVRSNLMDYGARKNPTAEGKKGKDSKQKGEKKENGEDVLGKLIKAMQVPHSWFWHFYAFSVFGSAFWAWQFVTEGKIMRILVERQTQGRVVEVADPDVLGRVWVAWAMMAFQGSRRLYECMAITKPGSSPMLAVHWLLGLLFYAIMGVSIWIESSNIILSAWSLGLVPKLLTPKVPSTVAAFLVSSWKQHQCHKHLAGLKKYTLPSQGLFKYIVCPHYFCECIIYTVIAITAAPAGSWLNRSVLCGLAFVAVNLGATAWGTRKWYAQKFGAESIGSKYNMVPFVF